MAGPVPSVRARRLVGSLSEHAAAADPDLQLHRAFRWGHRLDDLAAPDERSSAPPVGAAPIQLGRGSKKDKSSEDESASEHDEDESDEKNDSQPEEDEKDEKPSEIKKDPLDISYLPFGQQKGRSSLKGVVFRPPRSYKGKREEQIAKHFTTLLRTAGEHYATKKKSVDPVEVQSSYIGGNLYLATNSSQSSQDLVKLVKSGGGSRKVLENVKEPSDRVRVKSHQRIQSKLKKAFAGTREITGTDPEDVKRAKKTLKIMKTSESFTYLDPREEGFEEQLKTAKKGKGKVYVVPGEKHAELNLAEFRDEHLKDVVDERAKTLGSKRNCATCYSEMQTEHSGMASGQLPGLLVKNQLSEITTKSKEHLYDYMSKNPLNVTLLQHDAQDTGTASDSDSDEEGKTIEEIPHRNPKVPEPKKKPKKKVPKKKTPKKKSSKKEPTKKELPPKEPPQKKVIAKKTPGKTTASPKEDPKENPHKRKELSEKKDKSSSKKRKDKK